MHCNIFEILSLRSNGHFTCNHGAGQQVDLGHALPDAPWSPQAMFANHQYARMRALFRRGVMPWRDICDRCYALRPKDAFSEPPRRRIKRLSVEPSLGCALRCPSCSRVDVVRQRPGSMFLPLDTWRRVLEGLRAEAYEIDLIFLCGHGEPLAHPEFESFIAEARSAFPTTPIVVNTNGNYRLEERFPRGIFPDRFIVSVDGLHQASYGQYRIRGDVKLALDFMHAARNAGRHAAAVEWKYILFRHNDSDEELIAAQQHAAALDLDSLQFVITHTPERSPRFTPENITSLPLVWSRAYPETTPNLYFRRPEAKALSPVATDAAPDFSGAGKVRMHVDCCRFWSGKLVLRGWAMGVDGSHPARLGIRLDRESMTWADTGRVREDVLHVFPQTENRTSGFNAVCELPATTSRNTARVELVYHERHGTQYNFGIDYDLATASAAAKFNAHCP